MLVTCVARQAKGIEAAKETIAAASMEASIDEDEANMKKKKGKKQPVSAVGEFQYGPQESSSGPYSYVFSVIGAACGTASLLIALLWRCPNTCPTRDDVAGSKKTEKRETACSLADSTLSSSV